MIDAIFEMYPGLIPFFEECRRRAREDRWICGCFGRFRRTPYTEDDRLIKDFEREFMNCPIQGMIADALNRAVDHLVLERERYSPDELDFKIVLGIHDALLYLVPIQFVGKLITDIIPTCMCERVPIYPCSLDGMPNGDGPYHLGVDIDVFTHWGDRLMPDECNTLGFDCKFAGWIQQDRGYTHPQIPNKLWIDGKLVAS